MPHRSTSEPFPSAPLFWPSREAPIGYALGPVEAVEPLAALRARLAGLAWTYRELSRSTTSGPRADAYERIADDVERLLAESGEGERASSGAGTGSENQAKRPGAKQKGRSA